jgi:hypothetical protein
VTWYSSNYERADPTDNNLEMSFASWIGLSGDPDLVVGGNTNTTFWLAVNFLSATRASVNLTFVDMFSRQRVSVQRAAAAEGQAAGEGQAAAAPAASYAGAVGVPSRRHAPCGRMLACAWSRLRSGCLPPPRR